MKQEEMALRTRKLLAEALKDAMRHKPLSKITIRELTEAADLSRKTFYYYFEDIYALVYWIFEEEAVDVVRNFETAVDYEEAVSFIIDYVKENDFMIACALDSLGQEGLKRFFYSDFIGITEASLKSASEQSGVSLDPEYMKFVAELITGGLASMLLDWVVSPGKGRQETDPEKFTGWLLRLTQAVLADEKCPEK